MPEFQNLDAKHLVEAPRRKTALLFLLEHMYKVLSGHQHPTPHLSISPSHGYRRQDFDSLWREFRPLKLIVDSLLPLTLVL